MKEEKDILKQIGHRDGMTVPEGYFADFAARMTASLPVTEFEESTNPLVFKPKRTFWQRVKPYAYMAAMFAGVWCMLKMFTMITTPADQYPQPSAVLAEALNNDAFMREYVLDDVDQWDLVDDMMDSGMDVYAIGYEGEDSDQALAPALMIPGDSTQEMQEI